MAGFFLGLAFLLAAADWTAVARRRHRLRTITKPGTMLALMAWFSITGHWRGDLVWFGLALAFSLVGDIFLLLPERFFMAGLGAFLVGHLCTITGLNRQTPPVSAASLLILVLVGWIVWRALRQILAGLAGAGRRRLRIPVICYGLTIGLMLFSALCTLLDPAWPLPAAIMVSSGAALFVFSDSLLSFHRFVRPVAKGDVAIMVSYHAAEFLLAAGALTAFIS